MGTYSDAASSAAFDASIFQAKNTNVVRLGIVMMKKHMN